MTRVLAIDPGTKQSAFVLFDGTRVVDHGLLENQALRRRLKAREFGSEPYETVIEQVEHMGKHVGREVFETVFWSGRFAECSRPFGRLTRREVKAHVCHSTAVKDPQVRQALIRRFGGESAIKAGGALFGFSSHRWAALAVAVTWWDQRLRSLERGVA